MTDTAITYVTAWSKRGRQRHLIEVGDDRAVCGIPVDKRTLTTEPLSATDARSRTTCQRCAASA